MLSQRPKIRRRSDVGPPHPRGTFVYGRWTKQSPLRIKSLPPPSEELLEERRTLIDWWSQYADRSIIVGFNIIAFGLHEPNGDGTTKMYWSKHPEVGHDVAVPIALKERTDDYVVAVWDYIRWGLRGPDSVRTFRDIENLNIHNKG